MISHLLCRAIGADDCAQDLFLIGEFVWGTLRLGHTQRRYRNATSATIPSSIPSPRIVNSTAAIDPSKPRDCGRRN